MRTKSSILHQVGILVLGLIFTLGIPGTTCAASPAELLEKGIYTEETVGDIDAAMTIYRSVIEQATAARPHAAQAYFRLGMCLMKQDQMKKASALFEQLAKQYPDQKDIINRAMRQHAKALSHLSPEDVRARVEQAVETISVCTETDPKVQLALDSLTGLAAPSVCKVLAEYLDHDSDTLRRSAVFVLWKGDLDSIEPAIPGLIELCNHEEEYTRGMAALALGVNLVPGSFDPLCRMTADDASGFARRCSAYALGLLGRPEAVPVLQKALKDSEPLVANNAEAALRMLNKAPGIAEPGGMPKVVSTSPATLSNQVSPDLKEITVTFDQAMMDGSWSWTGGGDTFPELNGKPHYDATGKMCTLPVKLKPGKTYWVGINSPSHKNFQTAERVPAKRYIIAFSTLDENGRPIPLSDTMREKVERIHAPAQQAEPRPEKVPDYSQTHRFDLQSNGDALHRSIVSSINKTGRSLETTSFINSYNNIEKVLNGEDQELEFTVRKEGRHFRFAVTRARPIPPGESFINQIITRKKQMARSSNGQWTFTRNHTPIPPTNYDETIFLPPGAELDSAQPEPTTRSEEDGRIMLRYQKILQRNEAFRCTIRYRFPVTAGVETASQPPPEKANITDLQVLIDAAQAGGIVHVPKGTYTTPLVIGKALTLKGQSRENCVLELTSDEPALRITSTKPVVVEGLTIRWQRATSKRTQNPVCAVVLRDAEATLRNCRITAPGSNTRCPCAVLAMGFSKLSMDACRLDGFEYTIQIGGGAEARIENCLVMKPGHCGITVGPDGKAEIRRTIVTGSSYHGIRSTGGTLAVQDNLIVKNANRGIYLGNKSATGEVSNNVIAGNATGISGFANSTVKIHHNVIVDSSFAAVDFRGTCRLQVEGNVLAGNAKGLVLFSEDGSMQTKIGENTFWKNKTDTESFNRPKKSFAHNPLFKAPEQGDFTLGQPVLIKEKQGLTDAAAIRPLWSAWKQAR